MIPGTFTHIPETEVRRSNFAYDLSIYAKHSAEENPLTHEQAIQDSARRFRVFLLLMFCLLICPFFEKE
jgi:hypothetical protein